MLILVWEYEVKAQHEDEFRRSYGPDGEWVKLFRKAKGYLGTELLASADTERRFATIDRWESQDAWNAFKRDYSVQYHRLDLHCANLMSIEKSYGSYTPIASMKAT